MRSKLIIIFLFLALGLSAVQPAISRQNIQAQDPAGEMFQRVNNFRVELGLPPFRYNALLASAAQQQASFIAENNRYTHTGAGGTSPQDRANALGYNGYVVENIVGGTNMTTQQGLTWWINSPVHYNTLVSTRHSEAAVAYAYGNGQHRYTLVVGRPVNQPVSSAVSSRESQPAPLIIEPIILAQPDEAGGIVHTVGRGQALWSLAAYYDVPLSDLLLFNGMEEGDFLQPGDPVIIKLGEGQEPPPTPTPSFTHLVKKGQTLWTIAAIYNLKLSDLLWLNSLTEGAFIQPGQELIIRLREGEAPPPTPTPQLTYQVEEGDAYWSIAARFRLTLEELLAFNNLSENAFLQPGQELIIRRLEPTPYPPTFTPIPAGQVEPLTTPLSPESQADAGANANLETPTPGAVIQAAANTAPAGKREEAAAPVASRTNSGLTLLGSGAVLLALVGAGLIWMSRRQS